MKLFSVFVVLVLLLQAFAEAALVGSSPEHSLTSVDDEIDLHNKVHQPKKINCSYACSRRCRKASRKKICLRACKTCCKRCHCVPPGTYGNKNMCPCYARLKTHGHKPKCP